MDYSEILKNARECSGPYCKACPVCNGMACRTQVPGPGGYKQRLSMACALLHSPDILFLDEPTSGADPLARRDFWLRINALAEKGVTIIITTHFLGEAEFCDNMLIMMDGTTLAEGSPDDIRKHAPPREDGAPASLEDAFLSITEEHMKKGGEEA